MAGDGQRAAASHVAVFECLKEHTAPGLVGLEWGYGRSFRKDTAFGAGRFRLGAELGCFQY